MRRQWAHATALNPGLVEALSKAASACEQVWRKARPAGDFALVKPALAELLARVREAAAAKGAKLGCSPYDALLDEIRAGRTAAEIDALFAALAAFLPDLLERVLARQAGAPAPLAAGPFPADEQKALGERLMRRWASTSSTAASTSACIRSAAACRTTSASPRATTRPTSASA